MRVPVRIALAVLLSLLPLSVHAAALHWTDEGSTGTVDPQSNGIYTYTGAGITYNSSGSTVSILARYNVTNTTGTETPAWTTLEMGYTDPTSGGAVLAQLIQVDPCTGNTTTICSVSSSTATKSCKTCTFSASTINFGTEQYYVQVILNRTLTSQFPTLYTLRIF